MSNPIFEAMNTASLIKDISERERIIETYKKTGQLDREDAISQIQELRCRDQEVTMATSARLIVSSTPFSQCSNAQIIEELNMQRVILEQKLLPKHKEDTYHADTRMDRKR